MILHLQDPHMWKWKWKSESDVTYDQVWWPILGICVLHLSHPKCTHTAVNTHTLWTHTRSSGQPFMLRRPGSSWRFRVLLKGNSVVVLKVKRALDIHSPHLQSLPARDSNSQPLDYESYSLTIRPRLPPKPTSLLAGTTSLCLQTWCNDAAACSNFPRKPTRTTQIRKYYYKITAVNRAKVR